VFYGRGAGDADHGGVADADLEAVERVGQLMV